MDLSILANMMRPSRTAATTVAKLSSARTMSAASLATSVPTRPMAAPISALLQRRGVIDPVPRHGYDLSMGLPARTMRTLCSGETRRIQRYP